MTDVWGTREKPSNTTDNLLKEDSDYLLLEDGSKIVIAYAEDWTTRVKPT